MTTFYLPSGRTLSVRLEYKLNRDTDERRVIFHSKFSKELNEEIKASLHRGDAKSNFNVFGMKKWSAPDDCRTDYFIQLMTEGPRAERYYEEIPDLIGDSKGKAREHQVELINFWLKRKGIIAAYDMGTGKTFSALKGLEYIKHNIDETNGFDSQLYWVFAPKRATTDVWPVELKKWGFDVAPRLITRSHQGIAAAMKDAVVPPMALVIDEASDYRRDSKRTQLTRTLTEQMYRFWGEKAYILLLTGTPAPHSYLDWYNLCEIACPGFLRESSGVGFKSRLGVFERVEGNYGPFTKFLCWRNGTCFECGKPKDAHGDYDTSMSMVDRIKAQMRMTVESLESEEDEGGLITDHPYTRRVVCWSCRKMHRETSTCNEYKPMFKDDIDEIDLLSKRLAPIVLVKRMEDCRELPEVIYQTRQAPATSDMMEAAELVCEQCETVAEVLEKLCQFSDGFLYVPRDIEDLDLGKTPEVFDENPKLDLLMEIAEEVKSSNKSRLIVFARFKASVDLIAKTFREDNWGVIQYDSRGERYYNLDPAQQSINYFREGPLNPEQPIVYVGNPLSSGMALNLQSSDVMIFYSNVTKAEYRSQAEARNLRLDTTAKSLLVIDLACLQPDILVLEKVRAKIDAETLTLAQIKDSLQGG